MVDDTVWCVFVEMRILVEIWGGGGVCFKAEDGMRDLVRFRGLGDVYKRQGRKNPKTRRRKTGILKFTKSSRSAKSFTAAAICASTGC